jgi:hypothetical protein
LVILPERNGKEELGLRKNVAGQNAEHPAGNYPPQSLKALVCHRLTFAFKLSTK